MPLALAGRLPAVQICYPADLSLALNKIERFLKVSKIRGFAPMNYGFRSI
jgi:hypothetical protein